MKHRNTHQGKEDLTADWQALREPMATNGAEIRTSDDEKRFEGLNRQLLPCFAVYIVLLISLLYLAP